MSMETGQIIATSHDLGPQKVADEGKSPYFREIQVGDSFYFGQNGKHCTSFPILDGCLK